MSSFLFFDKFVSFLPNVSPSNLFVKSALYYPSGQLQKVTYGNNTVSDYTYDNNLRLTRIHTFDPFGFDIQDLNYIYDGVGNILQINDAVSGKTQAFEYDELSRLTAADGINTYGSRDFNYDKIGNIQTKNAKDYQYAGSGFAHTQPHAVTKLLSGSTTAAVFTYDANGNMATQVVAGITTKYNYTLENRLASIVTGTTTVASYLYDDDGMRTKKSAGGVNTRFVGSLYELTGSSDSSWHIFMGGQRVATIKEAGITYYLADHLGSTSLLTNADGEKIDQVQYLPFGETFVQDNPNQTITNYYFTDQHKDKESGLYYYGARYYNPSVGRFISADWIVQSPGHSQSLNRYSYAWNNPINFIDPYGKFLQIVITVEVLIYIVVTVGIGIYLTNYYKPVPIGTISLPWTISDTRAITCPVQYQTNDSVEQNKEKSKIKGVPDSEIGPSGKPKIHKKKFPRGKAAEEAATKAGKGKPIHHSNPTKGKPHFHPTDAQGEKIPGQHFEYPWGNR